MKQWDRATHVLYCGLCQHRKIAIEEPVLFVHVPPMTRRLVRCVDCSGPAPPDLPAHIVTRPPGPPPLQPLLLPKRRSWNPFPND